MDKFYEKNADTFAHALFREAYGSEKEAVSVFEVVENEASKLIGIPKHFDPIYTYNRIQAN